MAKYHVKGASRLEGRCFVQGSKNAALPILAASVLAPCETNLMNVPRIKDTDSSLRILRQLGISVEDDGRDIYIDSRSISNTHIPQELSKLLRSSVLFMGAVLARCGEVKIAAPGGCRLGARPIDLHIMAMRALGAEIQEENCELICRAKKLRGSRIVLPIPSVGATENAMLLASAAEGETEIIGAAREPEICDLEAYMQKLGVRIYGAGTDRIAVSGMEASKSVGHRISPDRMAASTLLCAAAATGGEIELVGIDSRQILSLSHFLNRAGCDIIQSARSILLSSKARLQGVGRVRTESYPGFPTDAQPLLMAALLKAKGESLFEERVFENRLLHVGELRKFGADISVCKNTALVHGVESLHSAEAVVTDLRGGAAMLIAALQCEGESLIFDSGHIERGYESIERLFGSLGADITTEN